MFFLAFSLAPGAYFTTHHFQASQVFKSSALYDGLLIMINSPPPPPLLPARSLHIALFPLVHYFLYTRGTCVTLKQRSGQFTKLFEGVTQLHPPSTLFSNNPLREKNFVPGHLGEIVAFVLKTKWRFGKCINIKFMISQGRLTFYKDVIFVSQK